MPLEYIFFSPYALKDIIVHMNFLFVFSLSQFFEYGSPQQRKDLANQLSGQILPLSLQMYGCRVIQKVCD